MMEEVRVRCDAQGRRRLVAAARNEVAQEALDERVGCGAAGLREAALERDVGVRGSRRQAA